MNIPSPISLHVNVGALVIVWSMLPVSGSQHLSPSRFNSNLDPSVRTFVSLLVKACCILRVFQVHPPSQNWTHWYKWKNLDWNMKYHYSAWLLYKCTLLCVFILKVKFDIHVYHDLIYFLSVRCSKSFTVCMYVYVPMYNYHFTY